MTEAQDEIIRKLGLPEDYFSRPTFEPVTPQVAEPTLSSRESHGHSSTVIQWHGEFDAMQEPLQFHFPLSVRPEMLLGHPEWFRVPFYGPLSEWPNTQGAIALAAQLYNSTELDGWAAYLVSGHEGAAFQNAYDRRRKMETVGFAVRADILLADPNVGVIKPQRFMNMHILLEEQAKVDGRHPRVQLRED